ncbi:MAG: hypothetical protein RLZ62_2080, partial [Bacteroidota bacterium]
MAFYVFPRMKPSEYTRCVAPRSVYPGTSHYAKGYTPFVTKCNTPLYSAVNWSSIAAAAAVSRGATPHAMPCATGMPGKGSHIRNAKTSPQSFGQEVRGGYTGKASSPTAPVQRCRCRSQKQKRPSVSGEPLVCAGSESRTRTPLLAYAPETYASTNS